MPRYLRVSLVALVAVTLMLAVMPAPASARIIVRGGWGPGWYAPGWGYGWGPGWYGARWAGAPYYYAPHGDVKIVTPDKQASVFVDGGYAGTVKEMHKFRLRPGTHDLAVKSPSGQTLYNQRIEVIRGKTTEIRTGS